MPCSSACNTVCHALPHCLLLLTALILPPRYSLVPCLVLPPSSPPPRYTRASFLFPEQQPAPHTSFDQECDALKSAFAGLGSSSAYVLGDGLNGLQWHVFVAGEELVPVASFQLRLHGWCGLGINGLRRHALVAGEEPVPASAQPACWWAQLLASQARPWNAGWVPPAVPCLISPAWRDLRAGTENAHATTEKPLYTLEVRCGAAQIAACPLWGLQIPERAGFEQLGQQRSGPAGLSDRPVPPFCAPRHH